MNTLFHTTSQVDNREVTTSPRNQQGRFSNSEPSHDHHPDVNSLSTKLQLLNSKRRRHEKKNDNNRSRRSLQVVGELQRHSRPGRRNSAKSEYTDATSVCTSVSFSSTKLAKILSKGGFKIDKDFEIEIFPGRNIDAPHYEKKEGRDPSISPSPSPPPFAHENQSSSPRDRTEQSERSDCQHSFSETKLGKLLDKKGFKIEKDFEVASICQSESKPPRNRRRERRDPPSTLSKFKNSDPNSSSGRLHYQQMPPEFSDSELSPITMGDSLSYITGHDVVVEHGCVVVKEKAKGTAEGSNGGMSTVPEAMSVGHLKDQLSEKEAKKKEIIEKIKALDAKLTRVLDVCYEASRKLKQMEEIDLHWSSSLDSLDSSDLSEMTP